MAPCDSNPAHGPAAVRITGQGDDAYPSLLCPICAPAAIRWHHEQHGLVQIEQRCQCGGWGVGRGHTPPPEPCRPTPQEPEAVTA